MSYSGLTKPSLQNVTNKKWCNWVEHWSLNAPNMPKGITKWSFSTTTLSHTLLKSSRKLWKHLTEMFYPTCRIRQTLFLRTTTCSGRWLMAFFTSYEEAKNWVDSWIVLKDEEFFKCGIHMLPERWSKVVEKDGQYFE